MTGAARPDTGPGAAPVRFPPPRAATRADLLLAAIGRRSLVRVAGASMAPALRDGDEVVVVRPGRRPIAPGDIVLARHPYESGRLLLKRVAAVGPEGNLDLRGDAAGTASTDSRAFGPVPPTRVLGRVTAVVRPRERAPGEA